NMRQVGLPLARRFQHTEGSMTWEWVFRGGEFPEVLTEPWVELLYYYPRGALQKPQRLSWYDPSLGTIFVRSDWDSENATLISSIAGPLLDLHHHLSQGDFTIFKRLDLAVTTGNYDYS